MHVGAHYDVIIATGMLNESYYVHILCIRPSSQYDETRDVLDTALKHKDRLDFFPCVTDAKLDASEHKFIA